MAGRGPAPKHPDQRARRNPTLAMIKLPRSGRKGRAPTWPLAIDSEIELKIALAELVLKDLKDELEWNTTARGRSAIRRKIDRANKGLVELRTLRKAAAKIEQQIWGQLWKTPQATQWELRGWNRDVALYARLQAKGEAGSLDDAKEARQWSDRLGLNDRAMKDLRWEIIDDEAATSAPARRSTRNSKAHGHLKVVG